MAGGAPHPPKVMGVADLAMFYVVTGVSLRWIATAAAFGPSSIVIWVGALQIMLDEGRDADWFASPFICTLADRKSVV